MSKGIPAKTRFFFSALCFLAVVFCAQGSLFAQTTGTILGSVTDQTDAVLPGAAVMVTNVETGIVRSSVAGDRGAYRVSNLPPGTYEVQASLTGFQTAVRSGITLTIGREAVVDFTLQVGDVTQQVTVTGEAPLIETTTSTVSGVVDSQQMRDIPLNARSFIEMVPLQAGATFSETGNTTSPTFGFGRKLSIVGTRYTANSFLLDGADMNDISNSSGSAAGTMTGVETVREFKVVTNAYDAEYGRHTGGVISAITKSGTNQIHGSIFEFLRNDNLDAAKWEDNAFGGGEKPEFIRNQFGAAVGGPVIRDRTFFFGSYEGLRAIKGETKTFNVPGIAAQQGLIDGEFIGIDPVVQPFMDAFSRPNVVCGSGCLDPAFPFDRSNGTGRFADGRSITTNQDFFMARIDHTFSDSNSLMGRFNFDDAERVDTAREPNTTSDLETASRLATLEETHIFSPALLSRTHFSFNRTSLTGVNKELSGFVYPGGFNFSGADFASGIIDFQSGLTDWGGGTTLPKFYVQNNFQFKEDIFYTTGRHSLKFGVQFQGTQVNERSDFHGGGTFRFDDLEAFMKNEPNRMNFIRPGSDTHRGWRQNLTGLYIHDDISVRPGLTLNVGLRYEFISTPREVDGKVANLRELSFPFFTTYNTENTDVGDDYFLNPSLKNFAPRIGLAWDPFQTGKTSVRAGFGMFHQQILAYIYRSPGNRAAPFFAVAEAEDDDLEDLGLKIDFPNAYRTQNDILSIPGLGGRPQIDFFQHRVEQPTVLKWSMDIQQQIASDTTLETGYSGTRGLHLVRGGLMRNVTPSKIAMNGRRLILVNEPQPNPNYNRMRWRDTDGASAYHAFRLSVTKRFSRSFQFQSSYTFSKSTDDSSGWLGSGDFGIGDRRSYFGEKEHGLSSFDVRHSWNTNFVVDLPGGNLEGAAGKVLGGWSLSSILRLNSGSPFNINAEQPRDGRDRFDRVDGSTLDLVAGGNQNPVRSQNPNAYFDVSQFVMPWDPRDPETFFMGNLGRNTLTLPGTTNVDFTLMKDTPLGGENVSLQFRAEFFNLFNRPNFGVPNARVFDRRGRDQVGAAEIEDTRTSAREMQLALKLIF